MQYADRDIMKLDEKGGYYSRHVAAMTAEGLHHKGDIAAELAFRDAEIDRIKLALSGRTQGYDADSYRAGMLAAAAMAGEEFLLRQSTDGGVKSYGMAYPTVYSLAKAIKAKAEAL